MKTVLGLLFGLLVSSCASLDEMHRLIVGPFKYSDGTSWVCANPAADFPARGYHASMVYDNKMWVIAGYGGPYYSDVWFSSDGTNWYCATNDSGFIGRRNLTGVVYKNSMWITGGQGVVDDVWYSTDGAHWYCATPSAGFGGNRVASTLCEYHGYMWLIGGSGYKDVWYTSDGTNWYCATNDAAFGLRGFHTSVVFNDKMWVIAGHTGVPTNSVWYTSDGTNWYCANPNPAFETKSMHSSVVYDNKMWVMCSGGGGMTMPFTNDVWYSADGTNWNCATPSAQFGPRDVQTAVVFKQRMWLIAGLEVIVSGVHKSDVWYSELPGE
jgi:leucine-zipper-like transcriptional regulator 1